MKESDKPQADTVPPPHGEDDVYQAATRVGPVPADLLAMVRAQRAEVEAAAPKPVPKPQPAPPPTRTPLPKVHPDAESGDESTEPTLDKPIRFLKPTKAAEPAATPSAPSEAHPAASISDLPPELAPRRPLIVALQLFAIAVVVALVVGALGLWWVD